MSQEQPVYLVLGATGSVGSQLCKRLRQRDYRVMLAGRDDAKLDGLATELSSNKAIVQAHSSESITAAVLATKETYGRLDGVANCIGSVLVKPLKSVTDDDWLETLTTNLSSSFYLLRAAVPALERGGSLVFVSSVAAHFGLPNHEAIAASKAGIHGLVLSAAASLAAKGIRVNAVAPGLVKSNMTRRFWESDQAAAASTAMHPLGKIGDPDNVASLIDWLLQPENDWITGQIIGLDGGMGCLMGKR